MVNIKRWLSHCFLPPWYWRMKFSKDALTKLERAITLSEQRHSGELRFAIENSLAPMWVWQGMSIKHRAIELFSQLRVWDTEENSGVLIYLLLADRKVQILADRGIDRLVEHAEWQIIADSMQAEFRNDNFLEGSLLGIEKITALLASHFPPGNTNPNELPNRPVIVKRR